MTSWFKSTGITLALDRGPDTCSSGPTKVQNHIHAALMSNSEVKLKKAHKTDLFYSQEVFIYTYTNKIES